MGTYLSRRIIEAHEGKVWADENSIVVMMTLEIIKFLFAFSLPLIK
ncbi:MAG: hypothetical protein WA421_04130 [Nitrososphaeraceae archaeon]